MPTNPNKRQTMPTNMQKEDCPPRGGRAQGWESECCGVGVDSCTLEMVKNNRVSSFPNCSSSSYVKPRPGHGSEGREAHTWRYDEEPNSHVRKVFCFCLYIIICFLYCSTCFRYVSDMFPRFVYIVLYVFYIYLYVSICVL